MTHAADTPTYSLVIHGGAGTITPDKLTPELEAEIRGDLKHALEAGQKVLASGGKAVDAVTAVITVLENSPHFNAGRGAVFTAEGKNEMDAAIMDGKTLNAGAVAGVTHVKNPILLARAVMEKSPHVMLAGPGAEQFADEQGIERADDKYFYTDYRWHQLQEAKRLHMGAVMDHTGNIEYKFGTVGAVARDMHGNLAAGTSTGGMTNKAHGRIGDSPIIGAGTYADNKSCAVSGTGQGEFFIRATVARSICALIEYKGMSLQAAADQVVMKQLVEMGGEGGIIAVDKDGNMTQTFNTPGMFRGMVGSGVPEKVDIYKD
ncbi:isoaspartyl peptidase/L-asparaginase family protein [Kordiimonas marina]|uniref:isoaspartyl peptidase/L-asparaginase family protein n=1 Tax=Kordiimonas marina TaxID=2872312 RepID=UPI001FF1E980|nr:isoaspartyl peptidase/L-asparaginase [Kordiimonas marina]MCJ9429075.1 isoaspartyl peptidase/L-asparaginase [Kordiimonas marina]